jgi:hypothetical protein
MTMDRIQETLTHPRRPVMLTAAGAAEIAAKSLRKAQTAIGDAGADNIVVVLQGWRRDCTSRHQRAAKGASGMRMTQTTENSR